MKILYVSGTYCPSIGGAEISAHSLLKRLQNEHSIDVKVLSDKKYSNEKEESIFDGINILGTTHVHREEALRETIRTYSPDFVITQLLWSDIVLKIAKEENIKSILRVCKIPFNLDISENSVYSPSKIMVVSNPVKEYIQSNWNRDSSVFNSIVEFDRASSVRNNFSNEYVLMFNNLVRKGAETFSKTAELLPNQKFAIVPGWDMLKKNDVFDDSLIKNMCISLGVEYTGQRPAIVTEFPKNVEILTPDYDVSKIYAKTKILCVPSIWQETFGRVATEGMMSNIPVIGSAVGGLKDIVSQGGIVIEDYKNPVAWAEKIQYLSEKKNYDSCVNKGKNYINNNYDSSKIVKDFVRWLKDDRR